MFDAPKKVVIDADSMAYMVCIRNAEEDDFRVHKQNIKDWISSICIATGSSHYLLCLTMSKAHRASNPTYKSKRKHTHIKFLNDLRHWMLQELGAIAVDGYEADDLLGIIGTKLAAAKEEFVLSYMDKDLKQFEWDYYDYRKNELVSWNVVQANMFFLKQLITGDSTDNVIGLRGKGEKFAEKFVTSFTTLADVYNLYLETHGDVLSGTRAFNDALQMLMLLRKFNPEDESPDVFHFQEFIMEEV